MADLNNTQFYDLEPVEEPKKRFLFPKKVVWAFVVVVLLALIAVIALVVRSRMQPEPLPGINPNAIVDLERNLAACETAEDTETCRTQARQDAARTTGEAAMCKELFGGDYDNCVELIARDRVDATLCDLLSTESQGTCHDAVVLLESVQQKNYARCSDIVDVGVRRSCEDQLIPLLIDAGTCVTSGVDAVICDREKQMDQVIASGNVNECSQLADQGQIDLCESVFRSTDQDEDGISDFDEVRIYGTDPNNSDTDGDGYPDGVEIDGGFDPLT